MTFEDFWQPLQAVYDHGEAKAIARVVMEMAYGLTMTDIVCGKVQTLDEQPLRHVQQRLLRGEPVQYVLGKAFFGDRLFCVAPGVLIPRPETFELCQWVVNTYKHQLSPLRILDIGTGSGCIACTLAAELPQAQLTAWDISSTALHIAEENVRRIDVRVKLEQVDILEKETDVDTETWDVIVSNPPYICHCERDGMASNVLDHEPALALFVPDDDPLRFYNAIARYAQHSLVSGGRIFFEMNPLYASPLETMLDELGFCQTDIRDDQFGKKRFISTCKQETK